MTHLGKNVINAVYFNKYSIHWFCVISCRNEYKKNCWKNRTKFHQNMQCTDNKNECYSLKQESCLQNCVMCHTVCRKFWKKCEKRANCLFSIFLFCFYRKLVDKKMGCSAAEYKVLRSSVSYFWVISEKTKCLFYGSRHTNT